MTDDPNRDDRRPRDDRGRGDPGRDGPGFRRREILAAVSSLAGATGLAGCLIGGGGFPTTVDDGGATTTTTAEPEVIGMSTTLLPGDGDSEDKFGNAVAVSRDGSTAVLGAVRDEDPNGPAGGSAYLFTRNGGEWTQQAKLTPADGDSGDRFGFDVAVSGDGTTAVVGARWAADSAGTETGATYVFSPSGGKWSQEAKLLPRGGASKKMGDAVAVSDDGRTVLSGAPGENTGTAYVFSSAGGDWSREATLATTDGDEDRNLGKSVGLSRDGTTALLGAPQDTNRHGNSAGSAYVFSGASGDWRQATKLVADEGGPVDNFGRAVALSGDGTTAIATTPGKTADRAGIEESGVVYVFSGGGGGWSQEAMFTGEDGVGGHLFDGSVAVSDDGTRVFVGEPGEWVEVDDGFVGRDKGGVVHEFTPSGGYRSRRKLYPSAEGAVEAFGQSVAVSGDGTTVVTGAPNEREPNGEGAGVAYAAELNETTGA